MATATKKSSAKKAPAKKAAPAKKSVAKKAPAKKSVAKKAPAKKAAPAPAKKAVVKKAPAKKSTPKKEKPVSKDLKLGADVFVAVDPRQNGGSPVAVAKVVKAGKETVNLTVFLDDAENQYLRDVSVAKSETDYDVNGSRVCWPA